jgi:ABC-type transport system substrate-binding protein
MGITRLRRRASAALLLVLLVLFGAACGSDDETSGDTSPTTAGSAVDQSGTVRVGYDLVQGGVGGFTLDPAKVANDSNDAVQYLVFGRLMRPSPDDRLEPDLAESVTVVDPNTIRVVLRDGLTFQDGTPFDAAAVKAGLDRTLASGNPGLSAAFKALTGVQVVDAQTLTLTIPNGTAAGWQDFLGSWETTIVKPETDFAAPVGAGPMRVVEITPEQSMSLERYDGYWAADEVNFAGMDLVHVSNNQLHTGIAALKADQIDVVLTEVAQLPSLSGPFTYYEAVDPTRFTSMHLCKQDGPLSDARVRAAVNKAIDREILSEAVFAGTAQPATEQWPSDHRFFDPDVEDVLAYDPDGARSLLAEAGYPDGFTFDLYVHQAVSMPEVAEVAQQQLAEIGVVVNIIPTTRYVADFGSAGVAGAGLVPAGKLPTLTGETAGNVCKYSDPELNALAADLAKVSASDDRATEIWHEIDEVYTRDALGVPIVFGSRLIAYDSDTTTLTAVWPRGWYPIPYVYESHMNGTGEGSEG